MKANTLDRSLRSATDRLPIDPTDGLELAAAEIAEQIDAEEAHPESRPLMHLILGRPLETAAAPHQTIGKAIGMAVFACA